jgi:hypothetical protein
MHRTSTSFKKGHPGRGGRPKGTKNGAGRTAWRAADKAASDIARRIDNSQSALSSCPELSADQRVRLLELLRSRRKSYEARSKYLRPVMPTGRIEAAYPHGVTFNRSTRTCVRNNASQPAISKRRIRSRLDKGARRALRKLPQLDKLVQALLHDVSKAAFVVAPRSSEINTQLRTLSAFIKVELPRFGRHLG